MFKLGFNVIAANSIINRYTREQVGGKDRKKCCCTTVPHLLTFHIVNILLVTNLHRYLNTLLLYLPFNLFEQKVTIYFVTRGKILKTKCDKNHV